LALADFSGRVVAVQDGDTLTVLAGSKQTRVRLDSIDAPEMSQAFGKRAKDSLAELCMSQRAFVREYGRDRNGRTIGRVTCAGVDANLEQVRRGMAWVFDRYATDHSLYAQQDAARRSRRGLWSTTNPMAPWEWRRIRRSAAIHPVFFFTKA
jgi:endonuclease YncB( thermonuclease family)